MSNYQLFYYKLRHKDRCPICEARLTFHKESHENRPLNEEYYCCNNHYKLTIWFDAVKDETDESIFFKTQNYAIYCDLTYNNLIFNMLPFGKAMIQIPAFEFDWKDLSALEEKIKKYILFS